MWFAARGRVYGEFTIAHRCGRVESSGARRKAGDMLSDKASIRLTTEGMAGNMPSQRLFAGGRLHPNTRRDDVGPSHGSSEVPVDVQQPTPDIHGSLMRFSTTQYTVCSFTCCFIFLFLSFTQIQPRCIVRPPQMPLSSCPSGAIRGQLYFMNLLAMFNKPPIPPPPELPPAAPPPPASLFI